MTLFCGPMRMLDAARRAWVAAGRGLADLSYETFGSSGLLPTETFRVRLADADVELVIPSDRSMLDVLNEAGHEVVSDCRRGECGVCAIDVVGIEGEIDHRDVFFSDHQKQANAKICPCVSRAVGAITVVRGRVGPRLGFRELGILSQIGRLAGVAAERLRSVA